MVAGIVDEHGSRIVSCGKTDNGASQEVNGDTLFDIAFLTKTFTALLLQDMIERGEMKLDDPVAEYLPKSVRMPPRNGREITLLELATHASGLPDAPGLSDFLAPAKMGGESKTKNLHDTAGMALLGQVIALKAGTDYESLVLDRICRPLKMDSTRITLTPELQARLATGHNQSGQPVSSADLGGLVGAVGLRSTASDMLKYLSANLGLTPSTLTPLMEKTHAAYDREMTFFDDGLAWMITRELQGTKTVWCAGWGLGCISFAGLDVSRHRGVVVLSNSKDAYGVYIAGMLLLQSEWQSDRRPREIIISPHLYDSCAGQYRLAPDFALGTFVMRQYLRNAPKAAIYVPEGVCLAVLLVLLRRAASFRRRCVILGGAVVVTGLFAAVTVMVLSHRACSFFNPGISIRRDGDRIFAQNTMNINRRASPITSKLMPGFPAESWPVIPFELLPETETRFFNRLTGRPAAFFRDNGGKVTHLTANISGAEFSFSKVSD
jgi:CubicO group peptidase (beta-lactamase class C family)